MLGDVAKELPEDAELEDLVDMDIPDLVPPTTRAFDFVEAEVRAQLGDLSRAFSMDILDSGVTNSFWHDQNSAHVGTCPVSL